MVLAVLAAQGQGVAPGGHRLGLQGLDGPAVGHLVGHHALDVVLKLQEIHHREAAAAHPLEPEAPHVGTAFAQRDVLPRPPGVGLHAQPSALAQVVVLEQDRIGAGDHHADPILRRALQRRLHPLGRQGRLGLHRLLPGGVVPDPGVEPPADAGREAPLIGGRRPLGLGKGGVGAGELEVVLPHRHRRPGQGGMVAGVAAEGAVIDVHRLDHGDGLLPGGAQGDKPVVPVVVPEAEALPGGVGEVQPLHGPGAVVEAHPDDPARAPGRGGGGPVPSGAQGQQDGGQAKGCNLHEFSLHGLLHFSTSGGGVKLTL